MKSTNQKSKTTIVFNIMIIMLLILSVISINPAQVVAEASQQKIDLGLLEIAQGNMVSYSIQGDKLLRFPLDVKAPQDGVTYYWEIVHPLPRGKVLLVPIGERTNITYQAIPGFMGEDCFGVRVSTAPGEQAKISVLITVNVSVDDNMGKEQLLDEYPIFERRSCNYLTYENYNDLSSFENFQTQYFSALEFEGFTQARDNTTPYFGVNVSSDVINGCNWTTSTDVEITIGEILVGKRSTDLEGWFYADPYVIEGLSFEPGQLIGVDDGTNSSEHLVRKIVVTNIDKENNIVSGTADPYSEVVVSADNDEWTNVDADKDGIWHAHFTDVDIIEGMSGNVAQFDENQNLTLVEWRLPNPSLVISPVDCFVVGFDWPEDEEISLYIDDVYIDKKVPDDLYGYIVFYIYHMEIEPGQKIVLTGGGHTRTHYVRDPKVTEIDQINDHLYGTSDPEAELGIQASEPGNPDMGWRNIVADEKGDWGVSFQGDINITIGSFGNVFEYDAQGNSTVFPWSVIDPNLEPYIGIFVNQDVNSLWVHGEQWTPETWVTMSVDSYEETKLTDQTGWAYFGPFEAGDLDGLLVKMTDGADTLTYMQANLSIKEIDFANNLVRGIADANTFIEVDVSLNQDNYNKVVQANSNGVWSADFSDVVDLVFGARVIATNYEGNNRTDVFSTITNPYIVVNQFNYFSTVEGLNWPPNSEISLEVNGVQRKTDSDVYGNVWFSGFSGRLPAGQEMTMSDGIVSVSYSVTNLSVQSFDFDANTISGTADPEFQVRVFANDGNYGHTFEIWPEPSGVWTTCFPVFVNISPGTYVRIQQFDSSGNYTQISMNIPNPHIRVSTMLGFISATNWPALTNIDLYIDDEYIESNDTDMFGHLYFYPPPDKLIAGKMVYMTDGTTERTHTIKNLSVTYIDQKKDIIFGTADPNDVVEIEIFDGFNWDFRFVPTDSNGNWEADFSSSLASILPGSSGVITQYDNEGNYSFIEWFVPNPTMIVYPNQNMVHGREWSPDSEVALIIGNQSWTETSNNFGNVFFNLAPYDIAPGQVVMMKDGTDTRTHTVRNINITNVDVEAPVINGIADADSEFTIFVWFESDNGYFENHQYPVTAGEMGCWEITSFPNGDISDAVGFSAQARDDRGNSTWVDWLKITSSDQDIFTVGEFREFTITTTEPPVPSIEIVGNLPDGITFNGIAMLSGAPATGSAGVYQLTITAENAMGYLAEQMFTLIVKDEVVIGNEGGVIRSHDNQVQITIEEDTVEDEIIFIFIPQLVPSEDVVGSLSYANISFILTVDPPDTPMPFDPPLIIRIEYDQALLEGMPNETILLYYWTGTTWKDAICDGREYTRSDTSLGEYWFELPICHLTEFAVLGQSGYELFLPLILK